jgi:hypothetical protein
VLEWVEEEKSKGRDGDSVMKRRTKGVRCEVRGKQRESKHTIEPR